MTHDPTRNCEHGRLKGWCSMCDLQAEVERLNHVNAELVEALADVMFRHVPFSNKAEYADAARAALAKAIGETK